MLGSPGIKYVKASLRTLLAGKGVLADKSRAFDALLSSLNRSKIWSPSLATYAFVDNCIGRAVRHPVQYFDLSASILGIDTESTLQSTLIACIAEQWPFVVKNEDLDAQKGVAEWIARFFSALRTDEPDATQWKIGKIVADMIEATQGTAGSILERAFQRRNKHPIKPEPLEVFEAPEIIGDMRTEQAKDKLSKPVLESAFGTPATSPDSVHGLDRWEGVDLETAVSSGRLSRLIQCLSSAEEETRRQAFLVLRRLMATIKVQDRWQMLPKPSANVSCSTGILLCRERAHISTTWRTVRDSARARSCDYHAFHHLGARKSDHSHSRGPIAYDVWEDQ